MNSGIYKITNKINNKVYVGSSINLRDREYKHFWMLKKNIHDNLFLQNSFNRNGIENFIFEVIDYCDVHSLVERENHHITKYKSNDSEYGYNLATVNEFRRNNFNNEVKLKLSLYNLKKNGNISSFKLTEITTNKTSVFDNLFDASRYLINEGFTNGSVWNVRQKISHALRGKKINNGHNGSVRKTIYKHYFETINN